MQSKHCVRTYDKTYIKSVLTHPSIWPHISQGVDVEPENYDPPIDEDTHFLKVDGGLFILHPLKGGMGFHANMIERGENAVRGGLMAFDYARGLGVKTLYAAVPNINPNVLSWAHKMGFKTYENDKEKNYLRLEL